MSQKDLVPVRGRFCPICGSDKIVAIMPFDYIKMCMNDKCSYRRKSKKNYRYQWSDREHN
jgi:hypothetical protein